MNNTMDVVFSDEYMNWRHKAEESFSTAPTTPLPLININVDQTTERIGIKYSRYVCVEISKHQKAYMQFGDGVNRN